VSFFRYFALFAVLASTSSLADESLTIAVASNFQVTAKEIAAEFTAVTQIPTRISAGSTGKLYAQIIHGAPFDVFLSADAARPKLLEENGVAVKGSRVTYATGALVLWSADSALENKDCLAALKTGSYRRLAIANPLTAPYGNAAKEFLEAAGIFDAVESRIVYGENISQTLQFVVTGNATLGLIALSQVKGGLPVDASCSWNVPSTMHTAIEQQAVLLASSDNADAARRFMTFLQSAQVTTLLESRGYTVPE
jgi:molybdate transport system substrate-binding protein